VLATTVTFANQREQFGRPIGKFQAVQHQLAVMAEQVTAARIAAQIGCAGGNEGDGLVPDELRAAVAKSRTSEAAAIVAPMAHAIHGAIGITADLDLQLYTRRLHAWRMDHGSEHAWNRVLGLAVLASPHTLALDFLRSTVLTTQGPLDA
jgi:acyl-CoA dehydrogenase